MEPQAPFYLRGSPKATKHFRPWCAKEESQQNCRPPFPLKRMLWLILHCWAERKQPPWLCPAPSHAVHWSSRFVSLLTCWGNLSLCALYNCLPFLQAAYWENKMFCMKRIQTLLNLGAFGSLLCGAVLSFLLIFLKNLCTAPVHPIHMRI